MPPLDSGEIDGARLTAVSLGASEGFLTSAYMYSCARGGAYRHCGCEITDEGTVFMNAISRIWSLATSDFSAWACFLETFLFEHILCRERRYKPSL